MKLISQLIAELEVIKKTCGDIPCHITVEDREAMKSFDVDLEVKAHFRKNVFAFGNPPLDGEGGRDIHD